jgi:hypothetical protein
MSFKSIGVINVYFDKHVAYKVSVKKNVLKISELVNEIELLDIINGKSPFAEILYKGGASRASSFNNVRL